MTSSNSQKRLSMPKADLTRKWNKLAPDYSKADWVIENLLGVKRLRRQLLHKASGTVLDVACGAGANFPYLQGVESLTGVDLSAGMLEQARLRTKKMGIAVDLQVMDAEKLDFPDNSFDTVVSALSTCTFPDSVAALREMMRVCRPGGRILLLEHGLSRWRWVRWVQHRTAPWHFKSVGCRWNQSPLQIIGQAGLNIVESHRALLGIMVTVEAAYDNGSKEST
jgi:ubiquinone/menaquinone biosynthesis C-methylase UbiE